MKLPKVFDHTINMLGEGPLWHPKLQTLFWFDILNKTMHMSDGSNHKSWTFECFVSAAGWVSNEELLVASATDLRLFNILTGSSEQIFQLESNNLSTRSNDGRADPFGGFWIGTMGIAAEPQAGSIYRLFEGEIVKLFPNITISNSICFSPDRKFGYFCDTPERQIMRVPLDQSGWPSSDPEVFIDLREDNLNPDGAIIDRSGNLWSAQWGASRVAQYDRNGRFVSELTFDAKQISCPAMGGKNMSTLFATSAFVDLDNASPNDGKTF
ncbi:MAG: SMP-30/gluconolactonase/LRE family protein, partial [Pseudomonadota bacterium]|nr:SMP-30/gluconolactonase/LRE family protein [Pseudomonadota bacterium]